MRQSGNKNGFTKVDHLTYDLILPCLSPVAQLVLLAIYRQTIGWKKMFDAIALSAFRSRTGIKRDETIRSAIEELQKKSLNVSSAEVDDPHQIIIPPTDTNDHFDGKDLIVVLGQNTETKDYGLPYMMLDPERTIADRLEERTLARARWQKRKGKEQLPE